MGKTELSMKLPKIGDKLLQVISGNDYDLTVTYIPEPCTVTFVNEKHGWYEVIFDNSDLKECYKLPIFDHSILSGLYTGGMPVACVETGKVYSSIQECADDMRIDHSGISRQILGDFDHYKGYHFFKVL